MLTSKYKKSKFYKANISLGLILVVVAVFSFWYTRSYLETGALLALSLLGEIPAANYVCFDYKNPAQISEEKLIIPAVGTKAEIPFSQVVSIRYCGILHLHLFERLRIDWGDFGKIYVGSYYENNFTFWEQILKNAKAKNPKVVIDPKLEKRVAQKNKKISSK